MKYCHICGTPIEDDSITVCPSCGRKQHSFRRPDGVVVDPYRMQAKKSEPAPSVEKPAPVVEPVKEEPAPVKEQPKVEPVVSVPEEEKTPKTEAIPAKKPTKQRKGLIIGAVAAVAVVAVGVSAALFMPGLLNRGDVDTSHTGGGNNSKPSKTPVEMDPIGTWAYGPEASTFHSFEEDGSAKYWQLNSATKELQWLYYGSWTRSGSVVSAHYNLYFNSGASFTSFDFKATVYAERIETEDGGNYYLQNVESPYVDPLCQCYDDSAYYSQASGKTGHFLELGLNNVAVFRQYEKGARLDFYKGTWKKLNATTLRITMDKILKNGSGTYSSIAPISNDLTIADGYLIWDGDDYLPATAKEAY